MRHLLMFGAALSLVTPALAGAAGVAARGEVAVSGGGHAFATSSSAGRSTFRNGGFARYGAPSNGDWGFSHANGGGGRHGGVAGRYRGRRSGRFLPYGVGDYGYSSGYGEGFGPGVYGPEEPYGDSAAEIGLAPWTPGYAPALAQGPYGPGYVHGPRSPYIGRVVTSGRGSYAYGYPGYAQTPPLPYPACGC